MDFIKRNIAFFVGCTALLLIAIFLLALIFVESGKLNRAKRQIASADEQIKVLMYADPAPNKRNLKAAQANLEELQERQAQVYQELRRGSDLETRQDGVKVISSILRYISDYKKSADGHLDANSEPARIEVPANFAFGFEDYVGSTLIPEGAIVPKLDKQRKVLSYILDQLFSADPSSIQAVRRENLEKSKSREKFQIDSAISARVPGVIDTLAFQVVFTGYTPSLRKFLNNLAYFELPVVVRSVEVARVESESKDSASKFFNTKASDVETPVISEIESIFTVTLEFVEVITPPDTKEEAL